MTSILFFDIKINPLLKSEFLDIIESSINSGKRIVQNGLNAASICQLVVNKDLKNAYKHSDLVNIDGMSIVWALRFLGHQIPERVACPDLTDDILALANKNNYSVFLLGAQESTLSLCETNIKDNFPGLRIVGSQNGYFKQHEELAIIEKIKRANPDILLLGMPSPFKELFTEKYKHDLSIKYYLGVGGLFEIFAGEKKRAPRWMQNLGMEWFYRFAQEPLRLWRRYLIGNLKFVWLVFKEKKKIRKI
jgi:N-acetylglucosaminyldiphosphoundecaprenol N-acetyl-beta-D-mannosaminyltransferase